jgi:hypothetical protein
MRMAEHIDRDARGEIEIAIAGRCRQPRSLASLESEIGTRVSRQKMREHGLKFRQKKVRSNEMCRLCGRHVETF